MRIQSRVCFHTGLGRICKCNPTIVGNIGAKASPASITANMPSAGPLANIISNIAIRARRDANVISLGPIAVRFFTPIQ